MRPENYKMPIPFPQKRIPKKIAPCPIIDSSVEVRFERNPKIPMGAVFGILYPDFQDDYLNHEELPILNIPEDLRRTNNDFKYQPHYKIRNKAFVIQIGPNILSVGCAGEYPGWEIYRNEIISALLKLQNSGITNGISRLGLRYINFFKGLDVFEKLDVELINKDSFFLGRNSFARTEFIEGELTHILQIGNSGNLKRDKIVENGSLIDIDVSRTLGLEDFFEDIDKKISDLHDVEKRIFFGLLDGDFLNTFNPEYD